MLDTQGIGYSEKGPNPLVQNTASPIFVAILLFFLVLIWLLCVSGSEEQLTTAHDILFLGSGRLGGSIAFFCSSTHSLWLFCY